MSVLSQEDYYCINICKGKCCVYGAFTCPNLGEDYRCKIYQKWHNNWCHYKGEKFRAWPILELLRKNKLPKEVRDSCCYAHPELLENINGG